MSLNTAISGLQAFQQQINVVGNNIANVNTTAFKSARTDFEDTFSQALSGGMQVGSGVNLAAIPSNFTQGTVSTTGVGSDLAIVGQGFFTVSNAAGTIYATRAGNFHTDLAGYLINNDGLQVLGVGSAPLQVDPLTVASYSIDQNGFINVVKKDGTTAQSGQVQLVSFADTSQLVKQGDNRYSWTAAAGPSAFAAPQTAGTGLGGIQSGALELSNVDLTVEMSNLIIAQRAFQANARIITTSDEVMQEVVNLKR